MTALTLLTTTLTGCAQSVDPIERLGKKAATRVNPPAQAPYHRWGLTTPLPAAPPHPAPRPLPGTPDTPALTPVLTTIPTTDKVVFLTYDDGAERDPRFVDMVRELRLPVSLFLTDTVVGPGYGHFARLQSVGANIQNHTLDHPALRGLPYPGQRAEICGQQDKLRSRFGRRPHLFRPPYGTYDITTRRAAADCGITAIILWRAAMGPTHLTYTQGSPHLHPGDIIAVAPDETTPPGLRTRTARLLRQIQKQGLTVARLEDYV
ncbi:polysaccharide deacetylase family protein [Streptomyces sp. yr375]|uniref:polysaccharide deacetylase family protein n=1 Tax=Streptomyces sp. yr375 TaxID=1761906 RepID=UPI000B8A3FF4|nr:polysaccharide deacetylase family protein [Streptomyces sp. yr375]